MLEQAGVNTAEDLPPETPSRVFQMYREILSGYNQSPRAHCKTFDSGGFRDLVTVNRIHFYSLCEHHLLPFFGNVSIGYVPDGRMLGLSKFSRIVATLARRLQTQERLTHQVTDTIWRGAEPDGLIVQISADHLCIAMRGARQPGVRTLTSEIRGRFHDDPMLLERFYKQSERR